MADLLNNEFKAVNDRRMACGLRGGAGENAKEDDDFQMQLIEGAAAKDSRQDGKYVDGRIAECLKSMQQLCWYSPPHFNFGVPYLGVYPARWC